MGEIFGYAFKDDALLEEALTTPSYRMTFPKAKDNQRLEFLGDAVLDFLAADQLFASCPGDSEGPLTVKRTHMVSSPALCAAAVRHGLGARLRRNKGAEPLPDNAKTYADAVEAILGAAWLDGGLAAARQVELVDFQSDIEGELVHRIGTAQEEGFSGIIINPGAYTHTSVAVRDALAGACVPAIEVHLSNISDREDFRKVLITTPACRGMICGMGA